MDETKPTEPGRPRTPETGKNARKEPDKTVVEAKGTQDAKADKKLTKVPSGTVTFVPKEASPNEQAANKPMTKEIDVRRKSSWGSFSRVVLCAIDASVCARYAFEWYLNNVWQKDDLIVLVHIPEAPALPSFSFKSGFGVPVEEWKRALDKMNTKMRRLEEDFEAECIKRKLKYKIRGESFKHPGEGICIIAEDEKADLIVIGSRGISSVKRALMGSVSEFVVRHAGIPCLIVRAKKLT